ncbi:DUF350 domain-containing protein [Alkalicoccus urumqiensis]|uniref:DUF350 domain-containing protein n=1 Tax=Alkalicoccus urumqiensis TaxID=1548213 RepID=A0A2P6MFA6_ALKUR|nr:DUF350 domain-containing protein [Alkalicoccus urumqiensis]PRO64953.1 DUF350 domain-containing protein [Alkalicoccus urumqiensis]
MEAFFSHEYVYTAGIYSIVVLFLMAALAVFEWITRYSTWTEMKKGNVAVALATSGKIAGAANIFRASLEANDSILEMMGWGVYGFVLLLFIYFVFEFLTPGFRVDDELAAGNKAVGLLSFVLSISLSMVIGATL